MNYKYYSDELYHFGILGQKWGVRRYQNPDGSLTPEGRERYGYKVSAKVYSDGSVVLKDKIAKRGISFKDQDDLSGYLVIRGADEVSKVRNMSVDDVISVLSDDDELRDEAYSFIQNNMDRYLTELIDQYYRKQYDEKNEGNAETKKDKAGEKLKDDPVLKVKSDMVKDYEKFIDRSKMSKKDYSRMDFDELSDFVYEDLEKMFPNFNDYEPDIQDNLWAAYVNRSGIYKYM